MLSLILIENAQLSSDTLCFHNYLSNFVENSVKNAKDHVFMYSFDKKKFNTFLQTLSTRFTKKTKLYIMEQVFGYYNECRAVWKCCTRWIFMNIANDANGVKLAPYFAFTSLTHTHSKLWVFVNVLLNVYVLCCVQFIALPHHFTSELQG